MKLELRAHIESGSQLFLGVATGSPVVLDTGGSQQSMMFSLSKKWCDGW